MKKLLVLFFILGLITSWVFAETPTPRKILVEYFSWINCPHCPSAQAGLKMLMADTSVNEHLIPITSFRADGNTGAPESPGHTERCLLYSANGVPAMRMNGTNVVSGVGGNALEAQTSYERQKAKVQEVLESTPTSPFEITPSLTIFNSKITISAAVKLMSEQVALATQTNRVYFVLTVTPPGSDNFTGDPSAVPPAPSPTDIHPYRVVAYDSRPYPVPETGDTRIFNVDFDYQPTYSLECYTAVVFVQRIEITSTDPFGSPVYAAPVVYQTAAAKFSGNIVNFHANITSGPVGTEVTFTNLSSISTPDPIYTWNFGDDSALEPSTAPTIRHTYSTVGIYDITLTASFATDDTEDPEDPEVPDGIGRLRSTDPIVVTRTGYIRIFEAGALAGAVSGTWNSNMRIAGNAWVPLDATLTINPGVTVTVDPDVSFEVIGHINAVGTASSPIIFKAETADTTWKGISITKDATVANNAESALTPSVFRHVTFRDANCALSAVRRNVDVEDCLFTENLSVPNQSSAPALDLMNVVKANILRSTFVNNKNGAITLNNSNMDFKYNVVANNTGNSSGGFLMKFNCTVNIENCTIYNNEYNATVGGTMVLSGSNSTSNFVKMTMLNTIISGTPPIYMSDTFGKATIGYTNFIDLRTNPQYNNEQYIFGGDSNLFRTDNLSSLDGSIRPIFVNASANIGYGTPTARADWYLCDDSIAIDRGNPSWEYYDFHDADSLAIAPAKGTHRNDMGAFGGGQPVPPVEPPNSDGDYTEIPFVDSLQMVTYPNPFNPVLNIKLNIKNIDRTVNVSVFNVKGQKVAELMNDIPGKSALSIAWEGKDSQGRNLGSGIYFVRAVNDTENVTKKVILLK